MIRIITLVENTTSTTKYQCKHGLCLYIETTKHKILFAGCSHAGIANIQNKAEILISNGIDFVIGGFHLYNPPTRKYESNEIICRLANDLKEKGSVYYTCHCTGRKAYEQMKEVIGKRLHYLSTGEEIWL